MPRCGHFIRREEHRHPLYKRLGSPQGQSGWMWRRQNFFATARFEPQTTQLAASRYISHAIQTQTIIKYFLISFSQFARCCILLNISVTELGQSSRYSD